MKTQEEKFDKEEKIQEEVKKVAKWIKDASCTCIYTGAGISTRGPSGVWTKMGKIEYGLSTIDFEDKIPTFAHFSISELIEREYVQHVITTNIDALHLKSGTKEENLSEIHGCLFKEYCENCFMEYTRSFDVTKSVKEVLNHLTGRKCDECGFELKDTIIRFGESITDEKLGKALEMSKKADLCIVLGTSMLVKPSCLLPMMNCGKNKNGKLCIVNLQDTEYDELADSRIYGKTDFFFELLMQELKLDDISEKVVKLDKKVQKEKRHEMVLDIPEFIEPESYHFESYEAVQLKKYKEKAEKVVLRGNSLEDLDRGIIKSDSCMLSIPEIELETPEGTPKATSIQAILLEIQENMKKHSGSYISTMTYNPVEKCLGKIEKILKGEKEFTLILSDPLGLSQIQTFKDDPIGKVTIQRFARTKAQNKEYGIE